MNVVIRNLITLVSWTVLFIIWMLNRCPTDIVSGRTLIIKKIELKKPDSVNGQDILKMPDIRGGLP